MKIFIIGMPNSGRTTVAKALCQDDTYQYINASSWLKHTFRDQKDGEHPQQYQEEYHNYLTNRIKLNPKLCVDDIVDSMKSYHSAVEKHYIIDGIFSPHDFAHLFDINKDIVIFLNRTDNAEEYKDSESIAVSVIRDYCFWMSSAGLLSKERWIEYNFKIPGEDSDFVKALGSKNNVYLVRSINKVVSHLQHSLKDINLLDHQS